MEGVQSTVLFVTEIVFSACAFTILSYRHLTTEVNNTQKHFIPATQERQLKAGKQEELLISVTGTEMQ